jgi:xanthine dehydrogenase YagT iron-sulfur-binding subunit
MTLPEPRQLTAAGGNVEVTMTVNGSEVTMSLPARVTLSDALRDNLGLTGTHVGCEHGICGMCTVLVDGEAMRSCLAFAVQLDGAEITTVEGLGRPDDLHPLQEAFGRHHGLQCGFCTPGFLMSSYDLLSEQPQIQREDMPAELSGVLCRCTGYRNILDAVDDAARAHPDGIPAPRNCGRRTLVGRSPAGTPQPVADSAPDEATGDRARPQEIVLPTGEPTISIDVVSELSSSASELARVFGDIHLLARCLPGAELTEDLDDGWYRGCAGVALGPVRLSFKGLAQVLEQLPDRIVLRAQGADTSGGGAQAHIEMTSRQSGTTTTLEAQARVFLTGRVAGFGRSLAGDVSRRMFEEFARAVDQVASGGEPAPSGQTPKALSMLWSVLADRLRERARAARNRLRRKRSV